MKITEFFYQKLKDTAPKCVYCKNYAVKRCAFWYFTNYGTSSCSASYQLCNQCPPPKQEARYQNYRVWVDETWNELVGYLLEYEKYSKYDRLNNFI